MKVTEHAKVRGLQRLAERKGTSFPLVDMIRMEILLKSLIKPSGTAFIDGTKYKARVEGFDNFRAIIYVKDGVHTLLTVTPII